MTPNGSLQESKLIPLKTAELPNSYTTSETSTNFESDTIESILLMNKLYDFLGEKDYNFLKSKLFRTHNNSQTYNTSTKHKDNITGSTNLKTIVLEEASAMDTGWEKYIDKIDREVSEIKSSIDASEQRIERLINRALDDIRDRDNQRHQEILAINNRIDQNTTAITNELRTTNKWIIGLAITTILAVTGIAVSVWLK